MPLVKQGNFKKYYKEAEKIISAGQKCHENYFDENDNYDCGCDVFSDFFYSVDEVYTEAMQVKTSLEKLLEIAEIKTEDSENRIKKYIAMLDEIIHTCKVDFWSIYDSFGNDFTDMERATLPKYKIFRDK